MECSFVNLTGKTFAPELGLHTDDMIQYHKRLIDVVKSVDKNIKICCQLTHAGVKTKNLVKVDINCASIEELNEI